MFFIFIAVTIHQVLEEELRVLELVGADLLKVRNCFAILAKITISLLVNLCNLWDLEDAGTSI